MHLKHSLLAALTPDRNRLFIKEGHKHCSYGQLVRNINLFNSKRLLTTTAKQRRRSDLIGKRGLVLQTPLGYQMMGQYA
jgi:hypothetical protein